ncbi:MAG: J domain-containing protein [Deltaproteobacteria bacterium]|nr:J domain-containing protein [Deltaproteobacteria bacterium]MBW2053561.1 J domain-containing protein [Deltaproteobacteria bacterium]MBW2142104.1 J domain-containing protein [Deltaproteobacteria bacterium]
MASSKNPFEIFGLTPEMVYRMEERDIFSLVKTIYRQLQKVYHPDLNALRDKKARVRDASRATEVNLAFEKLNLDKDSDSFRHYHKLYAARRNKGLRKKINTLRKDLSEVEKRQEDLANNFMEYLLKVLDRKDGNGIKKNKTDSLYLLPHPTNIKIGLNDIAINQNIRSCSWELGSNYKEIFFDSDGKMLYRPVGRSTPHRANYIHLLGTVETDKIDLVPLLNKMPPKPNCFKGPALDSRYGIDTVPIEVLNTLALEKFRKFCLPLLSPKFMERSYLFSIQRPIYDSELNISLEGVIVKISEL